MDFFFVEPEVAGGLGSRTKMDVGVHPPVIHSLHYELQGWLGDVLLESFPAFVLTQDVAQALVQAKLTGMDFSDVEITKGEQFDELYPGRAVPKFFWLKPRGTLAVDDFSCYPDGRLVVSGRALELLKTAGISNASVEPYTAN